MTQRFKDDELVVNAIPFSTVERNYKKADRAKGGDLGPRQHPEFFVPLADATAAALDKVERDFWVRKEALDSADREKAWAADRPQPRRQYDESELMLCTKVLGVETHGGRAPSHLVLIGSLAPPDNDWVKVAPKAWRPVLPKGAKPEECLVCTETHGVGDQRLFVGEFVRQDDPRVAINERCFRRPLQASGIRTFNTYVTEGS